MRGPDENGSPPVTGATALVLALAISGCGAYESADVCLVSAHDGRRTRSPVFRPVWSAPEETAPGDVRVSVRSGDRAERAELDIVAAAVGMVPALGSPRSAVEGIEHFSRPPVRPAPGRPTWPRMVVRLSRANGGASETWLIDGSWAIRPLDGGAMLVWEGDLAPVIRTLLLVLPAAR